MQFQKKYLFQPIEALKETKYSLKATQNLAPEVTHCVSAIRFIIHEITGQSFGPTYIGDMPRFLCEQRFLGSTIYPLKDACMGDIVFFYGISRFKQEMIRHVGIILDADMQIFFHSTWGKGGVIEQLIPKYQKKVATSEQLLSSRDPRNLDKN